MPGWNRSWIAVGVVLVASTAGHWVPNGAGQGVATTADADAIVPFTIDVPDQVLTDLNQRLARARFPDEVQGPTGWEYGTNLKYLRELTEYWRTQYDWRAQERLLNRFHHFKTLIDGVNVHFIHERSKYPNALPLVLTHGWPGSFFEYTKVIDPLVDPVRHGGRAADAFDVVVVSIPGYGFSDPPRESGYTPDRMARIIAELMHRLGYDRYGAEGGDWGSIISREMALNDASHVVGLHMTTCHVKPPATGDPMEGVTAAEREQMARVRRGPKSLAYGQIQSAKPQTLGYGLNDSPIGLAAWIAEKYQMWCDCATRAPSFSEDEILTTVMIYWVTQSITSSTRLYYEAQHAAGDGWCCVWQPERRVEVPTACALFPEELVMPPQRWLAREYNITRFTRMPRGGHFAALEEPGLLVDDLRAFFARLRA